MTTSGDDPGAASGAGSPSIEGRRAHSKDSLRKTLHALDYLPRGHVVAEKYAVESVIGEGATSVVYAARRLDLPAPSRRSPAAREADEESDRPAEPRLVALKIIHRSLCEDAQIVGRFRREAAILRRLEGPHVLRVYEMCEHDGLLVLVLEFVPSIPLDQRLLNGPELGVAAAIEIALQVCAGLGTAHACGVVHRDLKPANVLYAEVDDGEGILVKVADFGLAKLVHGDKMATGLTEHDMIFGTPEYMAPEQARGEDLDLRADIYALGCMLYEMLTGDVPFRGHSPMVTMTAHLMQEVVPPRKKRTDGAISPALEAVVMRALAKSADDRFPSARAFAEALRGADGSAHVIARSGTADALSDTDLNLQAIGPIAHSPTLPGDLGESLPAAIPHENAAIAISAPMPAQPAKRSLDDDITLDTGPAPPPTHGGSLWTWVVVGVLAAIAAIAIGVLAGAR